MDADRLRRILDALLGPVRRRLDYLALYPAEVLKDHGDNHVDVRPDDVRMSDLVRVPMETFLPGATVEVETGARVLLGFAGGDPAKPRARLWESGSLKRVVIVADEARIEATNAQVEADDVDVKGGIVKVDGDLISLAGGGPPVARVGDMVATPVGPGTIVQGSAKVMSG
jgi:hypothetical protein